MLTGTDVRRIVRLAVRLTVLLAAPLALGLAACGSAPSPTPAAIMPAGAQAIVQMAMDELAGRMGIKTADMQTKSVEAVEWPSAALGCPQPGKFYAQVITPGYKIVLSAAGKDYVYHSDRTRGVFCPPT